jgi:hypothetical protein
MFIAIPFHVPFDLNTHPAAISFVGEAVVGCDGPHRQRLLPAGLVE